MSLRKSLSSMVNPLKPFSYVKSHFVSVSTHFSNNVKIRASPIRSANFKSGFRSDHIFPARVRSDQQKFWGPKFPIRSALPCFNENPLAFVLTIFEKQGISFVETIFDKQDMFEKYKLCFWCLICSKIFQKNLGFNCK
jgi:hypothetical protein